MTLLQFQRVSYTNSFGTHPRFVLTHHMAAKKKPNPGVSEANASTEAPPSTDNALVPANNDNEDQGEELEVEDLADGEFEVDLHDLGISAEDILAMKRIDARLTEHLRNM